MKRTGLAAWIALLFPFCAYAGMDAAVLPIYIEDNHAGSFGWFARKVDLDTPHLLVFVDAHSDATAVDHSDAVRNGLRHAKSEAERDERIVHWRQSGRIQAFNWLEPLMPSPVSGVLWIAGWRLDQNRKESLRASAADAVDGRIEFEARDSGELGDRWRVLDAQDFRHWKAPNLPILASIDLDFFSGMPERDARDRFHLLWTQLLSLPKLERVSFAVSRPWLRDDAEAYQLLRMALQEVSLVRNTRVGFEPFAPLAPDDSLRAESFLKEEKPVPVLRIENAPAPLAAFLAINGPRYEVSWERQRWSELLIRWQDECGRWEIQVDGCGVSTDGVWRVRSEEGLPTIRVWSGNAPQQADRVRWWALRPAAASCNLLPGMPAGKEFAGDGCPWVREKRVFLCETGDGALDAKVWRRELDATGWGRVRLQAEVKTAQGWMPTQAAEIRVSEGEGFRAGLSEQFGMPYTFGIACAREGDLDGGDTDWGNDCSNFLIAGWRRAGHWLPWGNPAQLRTCLVPLSGTVGLDSRPAIPSGAAGNGVVIDFGRHMAALWEDRAPVGILDEGDLVVHHLGGYPEKVPLRLLTAERPRFVVRALPGEEIACRIAIEGDAVLSGTIASVLEMPKADLTVLNLEGVPAQSGTVDGVRYNFSFPPERLAWLKSAGIDAVGMANNHTGDAGVDAIPPGIDSVDQAGLGSFGAGASVADAVRPWLAEKNGVRVAFFAAAMVRSLAAGANKPGVAMLPEHACELEKALAAARSDGRTIIVLVHWGAEYSDAVDEEQRRWAKWLIDRGADVIVGAHPHVVQALDTYRGKWIAYSLGNAIYPESLSRMASGAWLEIGLDRQGRVLRVAQHSLAPRTANPSAGALK